MDRLYVQNPTSVGFCVIVMSMVIDKKGKKKSYAKKTKKYKKM